MTESTNERIEKAQIMLAGTAELLHGVLGGDCKSVTITADFPEDVMIASGGDTNDGGEAKAGALMAVAHTLAVMVVETIRKEDAMDSALGLCKLVLAEVEALLGAEAALPEEEQKDG